MLRGSQVFVSDRGSNLYALDLRNGNVTFGYKGKTFSARRLSSLAHAIRSQVSREP